MVSAKIDPSAEGILTAAREAREHTGSIPHQLNPRNQRLVKASFLVRELQRKGWTQREIASHPNIDRAPLSIYAWKHRKNAPSWPIIYVLTDLLNETPPHQEKIDLRPEMAQRIQTLLDRGWRPGTIAHRLEVTYSTVHRYAHGVTCPSPKSQRDIAGLLAEKPPQTTKDMILSVMVRNCYEGGIYARGAKYIADIVGIDPSHVSRVMKRLKDRGTIIQMDSEPGHPKRWRIREVEA